MAETNTPIWTQAQERAIVAAGHPVLVSAAAGSGKTAVLCERIMRKLLAGESIGELLIVTFTRAAAAQLRTKLAAKLREGIRNHPEREKHLRRQLLLLPAAKISTIDSFYLELLHTYFGSCGISADVRVLDEQEKEMLESKLMADTLASFASEKDAALAAAVDRLVDCLGRTDPQKHTEENLLQLRMAVRRRIQGLDGLQKDIAGLREEAKAVLPFSQTVAGKVLYDAQLKKAGYYRRQMERAVTLFPPDDEVYAKYGRVFAYFAAYLKDLCTALSTGEDAVRALMARYNPPESRKGKNVPADAQNDEFRYYKEAWKSVKAFAEQLPSALYLHWSDGELSSDTSRLADLLETLEIVLRRFEDRLWAEKMRLGAVDYDDMALLTLDLLRDAEGNPTPVAKELSEHYREVCIDEYQDTSDLQDLIFSLIAPVNRFMVGDVKQSIYRFRGACPSVFERYRQTYTRSGGEEFPSDAAGELVALSDNFRCDRGVIDFSNAVCGSLFAVSRGIGYIPAEDALHMGKKQESDAGYPVRLLLADAASPAPGAGTTGEAEMLAAEIIRLITEEGRAPEEIAVLVRSLHTCEEPIRNAFRAAGIPFTIGHEEPPDHQPEILLLHSLLRMGHNPLREIDLCAGMYSPVFGFTLPELLAVREYAPKENYYRALCACAEAGEKELSEKCRRVLSFLGECRRLDRLMPPDRVLLQLMERYRLLPLLSYAKEATLREKKREQILQYYSFACSYSSVTHGKGGLGGMLDAAERMLSHPNKRDGAEVPGCVRVMTIHGAKGLEFPVTVLYGCGKALGGGNKGKGFTLETAVGAAADLPDETGLAKVKTPRNTAGNLIGREEELDEELRVLYVALTRAEQQLILTGECRNRRGPVPAEQLLADCAMPKEETLSFLTLQSAPDYLHWILYICLKPENRAFLRIEQPCYTGKEKLLPACGGKEEASWYPTWTEEELDEEKKRFSARFSYRYPGAAAATIPAKLSVTALYPDLLDELSGKDLLRSERFETPRFVQEKLAGASFAGTAAERGIATHEFMQFCHFERCSREGAAAEKAHLVKERFLSAVEAERAELKEIDRFFASSLYASMRRAKRLYREQRFNITLPASAFTGNAEKREALSDQTLLVQGVIDCFFEAEDGKIILLDYKTDHFTEEEKKKPEKCAEILRERHSRQLGYYAAALERLLGKKPDRVLLWSFDLGKEIELTGLSVGTEAQ